MSLINSVCISLNNLFLVYKWTVFFTQSGSKGSISFRLHPIINLMSITLDLDLLFIMVVYSR